tara:strand:+ start:463 stop:1107 length:645 start_codon:yes stop_codon:yes gene_type:complete
MADHNSFPEIMSLTLFKHNSIDNKIFTLVMDNCQTKKHKGTYLVRSGDLFEILKKYFKSELDKIEILSQGHLYKNANTIYFLYKMLNEMKNLRWFQIKLSKNLAYNRMLVDYETGSKVLDFDFKVIRGTFRTYDFFKDEDIEYANKILLDAGCFKKNHYCIVKLKGLIGNLEAQTEDKSKSDEEIKSCFKILTLLQEWKEDNPQALIVTDFLDI